MAHEIEIIDGVAQMAYVGNTPWHGLGKSVPNDLSPEQMLEAAGLNWSVEKKDIFLSDGTMLNDKALVRSTDNKVLSVVSKNWNEVQNLEAFQFFDDFVKAGDMEMHTAGSLKDGKMIWALAKIKESFTLFGDDTIDNYLLFSNPHEFGKTIEIRVINTRVVCMNTLSFSLKEKTKHQVKLNHRRKFDGDLVKETLGISSEILNDYKKQAEFLGSKYYTKENMKLFYDTIFPSTNEDKEHSRNSEKMIGIIETQPGAYFAEGTFWSLFNSITYYTNHLACRNQDNRLHSLWYGNNSVINKKALNLALQMAATA